MQTSPITLTAVLKTHAIGALVCLALLGAGYQFGLRPMMAQGESPTDWQARVDTAQAEAALQEATVQRLGRELELSAMRLEARPMQLMQASAVNRRLSQLSDLAKQHGLVLASSQPGTEATLAYYAYVPITLGGQGGFAQVVAFLGALHEAFPDMGVHGFSMSRSPVGGGRFDLILNWFVRPTQSAEVN